LAVELCVDAAAGDQFVELGKDGCGAMSARGVSEVRSRATMWRSSSSVFTLSWRMTEGAVSDVVVGGTDL